MRRLVLAAALLLTLLHADHALGAVPSGSARGVEVARGVWGPVCGHSTIRIIRGRLAPQQVGEARWTYDPTAPRDARRFRDCRIVLAKGHPLTSRQRCAVIVHELGHLAGREHSRSPRSVMYRKLNRRNVPRACR